MKKQNKMFLSLPFKKRYWIKNLSELRKEIKWAFQRMKYGYSDCDVWNIDDWFLDSIVPMLQQLKENLHGYPSNYTFDEWNDILEQMIFNFTEGNEDISSKKPKDFKNWSEYNEYIADHLNKGLKLFVENFHNLWD